MTGEQEPNGWELLRAIRGIQENLTTFASNYVPLAVYQTLVERVQTVEKDADTESAQRQAADSKEKQEREVGDAALQKRIDDQQKTKAQQWFGIGLLAVGGAITLLVSIFRQGLGLP